MKLEVKNIGKKLTPILFVGLSVVALVGCLPELMPAAPTDTLPVATQTVTPTSTPSSTPTVVPTNTPSPTSMPELTYEQKKALLGINKNFESIQVGSWITFEMNFEMSNGETYEGRQPCFCIDKEKNHFEKDVFSITNGEYLFTISIPQDEETPVFYFYKYLTKSSSSLKNLTLKSSVPLVTMGTYYASHGIDYQNYQYLNELADLYQKKSTEVSIAFLTEEEISDIIIGSTPQAKIIPFWIYTPGAKIPDELKGLYLESAYPPAPALPDTTVQQSSREYNGFGYKAYTSKDGASNLNYTFDNSPQKDNIDDNVIHGYRTKNYYDVTGINHPYKSKIKI